MCLRSLWTRSNRSFELGRYKFCALLQQTTYLAKRGGGTRSPTKGQPACVFLAIPDAGRIGGDGRQAIATRDHRIGGAGGPLSRIPEWSGNGPIWYCFAGVAWARVCSVRPDLINLRIRGAIAGAMGAHRGARRRKLDRRQRIAHAGLGCSRELNLRDPTEAFKRGNTSRKTGAQADETRATNGSSSHRGRHPRFCRPTGSMLSPHGPKR